METIEETGYKYALRKLIKHNTYNTLIKLKWAAQALDCFELNVLTLSLTSLVESSCLIIIQRLS